MQTITQTHDESMSKLLAGFWLPHLESCEDLFRHLAYVDQSMKAIRADALRHELAAFDDLLATQVPEGWHFKEYRRRTIITLVGRVTYLRRIYTEPSGVAHAYLDEVLGIRTRRHLAPDAFLWIAKMAAELSFRKTAKAFYERTGARISHWLVMEVIHEEGALILEELYENMAGVSHQSRSPGPLRLSADVLYVEYDGIHIPLQKPRHGPLQPRRQYEDGRHRTSVELKSAVAYLGKDSSGRRGGQVHFVADERPGTFWPLLATRVAMDYAVADIQTVYASHDAAGWCRANRLDLLAPAAKVVSHLDAFHVNREIRRAFGPGKAAGYVTGLIYARRTKRLFAVLERIVATAKKGRDRDRYCALRDYLWDNELLIASGLSPSMGTMEGTNAHVYAARMKVWGGGWSRRGALAMALVRAHLASGRELIAPHLDNILLTDIQQRRRQSYEESQTDGHWHYPEAEGSGYEPPQAAIVQDCMHMPPKLYGCVYGVL